MANAQSKKTVKSTGSSPEKKSSKQKLSVAKTTSKEKQQKVKKTSKKTTSKKATTKVAPIVRKTVPGVLRIIHDVQDTVPSTPRTIPIVETENFLKKFVKQYWASA
tara:strand:- start:85 stop:402 length:318 start_codon:yes stop_codon:yes gene_type:complete